jgi:MerR family transcriptional regulator, light-induced transcriptional regulator
MKHFFEEFMIYIEKEEKDKAVLFAVNLLKTGQISIEELYFNLLTPSLLYFSCQVDDEEVCIWKEHARTSIIRTILEISYLYVVERVKECKKINKKVVVLTPALELHEIGAIMNTHFFMLEGFNASYIGANTPKLEILSAIRAYQPDFIALSVTNPYNLVITKQITDDIKKLFPQVGIILGGQAFKDQKVLLDIKYDYVLQSLADLKAFREQVAS